eukprot:GHRQ01001777.1.p3 GENE.GHRQ01001777.1~~GHRQ01001777.1.p3  ORF type:complete len:144 (+),score=33.89 GHRQ01001777.1:73-504(+)
MGRVFVEHITGKAYCCKYCHTHLAKVEELLSKQFHSKNGPAWLFGQVINVVPGPKEERLMTTGMHVVSDISCTKCCALLGWKYEAAHEDSQKYKVGRFILERAHVAEAAPAVLPPPPRGRLDSSAPPLSFFDSHSSDVDDHYF